MCIINSILYYMIVAIIVLYTSSLHFPLVLLVFLFSVSLIELTFQYVHCLFLVVVHC